MKILHACHSSQFQSGVTSTSVIAKSGKNSYCAADSRALGQITRRLLATLDISIMERRDRMRISVEIDLIWRVFTIFSRLRRRNRRRLYGSMICESGGPRFDRGLAFATRKRSNRALKGTFDVTVRVCRIRCGESCQLCMSCNGRRLSVSNQCARTLLRS